MLVSEREQVKVCADFFSMIREKHIMENMEIFLDKWVTYLLTPWNRVLLEKLTSKLCS
jgi:hypothetical protein